MAAVDLFESIGNNYGIEENGLPEDNLGAVNISEEGFALTIVHLANLDYLVDPQRESNYYGIDLYEETLYFITNAT